MSRATSDDFTGLGLNGRMRATEIIDLLGDDDRVAQFFPYLAGVLFHGFSYRRSTCTRRPLITWANR